MYNTIPHMPEDPVLGLVAEFKALCHPQKVNLGVGIYQTEEGGSKVFDAVRTAEQEIALLDLPKDYLPISGDPEFIRLASCFILGPFAQDPRHLTVQTVGGTSALSLGARFLKEAGYKVIYISDPTWPNHPAIFKAQGFGLETYSYPLFQDFSSLPEKAVVLLQASCHNPTGIDPAKDDWKTLFETLASKKALLFFDNAYQGFKEDIEEDAWPIQEAMRRNLPCLVASSFSKNFGLYGERVGLLTVFCEEAQEKERIFSFIKTLIRSHYSNPPLHGARVVHHLLSSPLLTLQWREELKGMRERLGRLRESLASVLPSIQQEHGLFSMTGFGPLQVEALKQKEGILMLKTGRINLSGLNSKNIDYVKQAFRRWA